MPGQRLVVANFPTGFETDRTAININNDAFPVLINAYVFRGRILKKPGTIFQGILQRDFDAASLGNTDGGGAFSGNLISLFSLESGSSISTGSISVIVGGQTFTEPSTPNGTLTNGAGGTGTINYATGAISLQTSPVLAATAITISFGYFPHLPVMGLKDIETTTVDVLTTLGLDTTYSYQFTQPTGPWYDTTFYKGSKLPFFWNGTDSQQFWTTNYSNALWATNNTSNVGSGVGMQFKVVTAITQAATAQVTITAHGIPTAAGTPPPGVAAPGITLWFNEVSGMTEINGMSATVATIIDANNITINLNTTGFTPYGSGGIAQYITFTANSTVDGIKWYDGDPTLASPPNNLGWVNFSPPLSTFSATNPNPQYLIAAVAIVPFKDRLLFFGPTTQTSNGSPVYFEDRVIYSWNGTPYYTNPVPTGQVANAMSWIFAPDGSAGYQGAGIRQQIVCITINEDVLLVDFEKRKTKLIYTGNDLQPFLFYSINSELGAESTFSGITLDAGGITIGNYGIALTTQYSAQRIDLVIPDQVFQIDSLNNGVERVNAVRDFRNEYIFWSYPTVQNKWKFPTRSFLYNYRDNTWAILKENFTAHGQFQRSTSYTWADLGRIFGTWNNWKVAWGSGRQNANYPNIIGGTQQGFVLYKTPDTTGEAQSAYIVNITVSGSTVTINSPNHCMESGDYVYFQNIIGTTNMNETIRRVALIQAGTTFDPNNFNVDTLAPNLLPTGTYLGGGTYARLTQPLIQTKQFHSNWEQGRQTRIGTQWYLFDRTSAGQCAIQLYLNQNANQDFNEAGPQGGVIYTQTILTSPENTDSRANDGSERIWHRMPQSLVGDTVQLGITLSDEQMRNLTIATSAITLHAFVMDLYPAGYLAL